MDKKPRFLVPGVSKAGTTSLYHLLKKHPNIYLSSVKESHFFNNESAFEKGFEWYVDTFFSGADDNQICGDITPAYFNKPGKVIPRLMENFKKGELKIILLLRDPVERAWSHYLHNWGAGVENHDFSEALSLENERLKADPDAWVGYFSEGLYGKYLSQWTEAFGKENILIVKSSDLKFSTNDTLGCIFDFLGLTKLQYDDVKSKIKVKENKNQASIAKFRFINQMLASPPEIVKKIYQMTIKKILPYTIRRRLVYSLRQMNKRKYRENTEFSKPELGTGIQCKLYNDYAQDILRLEKITGMDFSEWKLNT
ncbi:MAG: sulfotransferase domain-containing protein [Gammaproteobacteria bacterium]|nr:sulfotransferase domain-containing protein [Gammaproteobacteria bacterium]